MRVRVPVIWVDRIVLPESYDHVDIVFDDVGQFCEAVFAVLAGPVWARELKGDKVFLCAFAGQHRLVCTTDREGAELVEEILSGGD